VKFDDGQATTKLTVKNRTASTDSEPSKPTDSNSTKSTGSDSPQTGDNSNIGLWLALMLLSAAVTALLISSRKNPLPSSDSSG
jgi:LPXTG-motif cell wall-anchored protein